VNIDVREAWRRVERALASPVVRTAYLWGPPGTGKTYAAFNFGRVERGIYSVTLTPDTSAAELRGHFVFKGGDTLWHHGPFARAMIEGSRLVINEISNASADVLALLFPILESWETARLTLPNNETLRPAEGFHVIATDNHPPDNLIEALQDRFVAYLYVAHPHPDALAGLDDELRPLAESALHITDNRRISARGWSNLQMLRPEFEIREACLLAFGPERGAMLGDAIALALNSRKRKLWVK